MTVKLVITLEGDSIDELALALSNLSIANVQAIEQPKVDEKPAWVQAAETVLEPATVEKPTKKVGRPKSAVKRVCTKCGTTNTPQWRRITLEGGPLCNACEMSLQRTKAKPKAEPKPKPKPVIPRISPADIGGMVHAALKASIADGEFVTAEEVANGLAIEHKEDQKVANQMAIVMMRMLEETHVLYYKVMPEDDTCRLLVLGYDAPVTSLKELMKASGA